MDVSLSCSFIVRRISVKGARQSNSQWRSDKCRIRMGCRTPAQDAVREWFGQPTGFGEDFMSDAAVLQALLVLSSSTGVLLVFVGLMMAPAAPDKHWRWAFMV